MTQDLAEYVAGLTARDTSRQRASLTFRGNVKQGRHGWLRLTPAYSLQVVNEILDKLTTKDLVLDPFSGSATTVLASSVRGIPAHSVDINPFLVWFGNLKVGRYDGDSSANLRRLAKCVFDVLIRPSPSRAKWSPKLHQIEKWWDGETLDILSELFAYLRDLDIEPESKDLLKIAFCKAMISSSYVSFRHQSMSFKKRHGDGGRPGKLLDVSAERDARASLLQSFCSSVDDVTDGIDIDSPRGDAKVVLGDSRHLDRVLPCRSYSVVITSPPYPNRISYIRELRPYMYWLGYLTSGREAGDLDWEAIGGTWGRATSQLSQWQPSNGDLAFPQFEGIVSRIAQRHELLAKYVWKYFDDIKLHLRSLRQVLISGGRCFYVVGNSKFYDTLLPVEEIYAALFEDAGFTDVGCTAIRKRTSKKELFEYVVYARNPASAN